MAGHSQYSNIMHRKNAQDSKRAKVFSKIAREISVAARNNPDPSQNPSLRSAISEARSQNMPKDRIQRAISASSAKDGEVYDEIRYEGFGPGGVAVIVEALTENRNRTASDVRTCFQKNGGNMGEPGTVSHMFDRVGLIRYPADASTPDAIFEAAIEAGAEDCESTEDGHEILCRAEDLSAVRDSLEQAVGKAAEFARIIWRPQINVPITEDQAITLFKMLELLEDNDDVQRVFANYEVDDAVLEKLSS